MVAAEHRLAADGSPRDDEAAAAEAQTLGLLLTEHLKVHAVVAQATVAARGVLLWWWYAEVLTDLLCEVIVDLGVARHRRSLAGRPIDEDRMVAALP
jgi:hypothetical protein